MVPRKFKKINMNKIPLVKPEFDSRKIAQDLKAIATSGILTRGKYLVRFEGQLVNYLKVKYVFATSSCTTALHLALLAANIDPGDEVLTSDFSFPATGNVVVQVGAKPVFVDIDLETLCINIEDLKKKITSKSKAIMVVHAFGYPANMTKIRQIARKNKLILIEDAACALGSKHKNKLLGTWGDIGCFSFHPRKNITTGEGGAIVTNNPKIAKQIDILRNHGGVKKGHQWEFVKPGYNYRLSELQAALGTQQMPRIDQITRFRQEIAKKYLRQLKDVSGLILPQEPKDGFFNWQSFVVLLPQNINRDQVIEKLHRKKIESVLGTYAMHSQRSFRGYGYEAGDLPNSYFAYRQSLTLPLFAKMTDKELEYVVNTLKKILNPKFEILNNI